MGVTSQGFYSKYSDQEPGGPIQDISFTPISSNGKLFLDYIRFMAIPIDAYHSQYICKLFEKPLIYKTNDSLSSLL